APPGGKRAEAPLAATIRGANGSQRAGVEVGPRAVREQKLRAGALPEQEGAEPLLPSRADEEVHVGCLGAGGFDQEPREALALALLGGRRFVQAVRRFQDRVARRVIDGEPEVKRAALGRRPFGV